MKTTITAKQIRKFNPCEDGFETYLKAHGEKEVKLSEALESNGWNDFWWLLDRIYEELSESQKQDLTKLACDYALINIEKIKPYCSDEDYQLINKWLTTQDEELRESAESAARSAAMSAWSAATWSARSAEAAATWSASSAAAMKRNIEMLKELLIKWESSYD